MTITQFIKDFCSDINTIGEQGDYLQAFAEQRAKSLVFRGVGVYLVVSSGLNILAMPHLRVASIVWQLFRMAIGHDLIVIGINQRAEIGGSARRAAGNLFSAWWNEGHRHFEGTLIIQHIYRELQHLANLSKS